jgi:hypothetical protein
MNVRKVAIHQPNFFPWIGFFNKIYKADQFIYLDHVENNPRSAIYTKRVKIIVNREEHWLTCNLKSIPGQIFCRIDEMRIDNPERLKDKHLKTIELSYKKATYFSDVFPIIQDFYDHKSEFIADRNIFFIESVCDKINIATKRIRSNTMGLQTSSNQLLIDIVKSLEANCYIPGGGASDYQDDILFDKNEIKLEYQSFVHPKYEQFNTNEFVSGLSVIDLLMNKGFKEGEILVKNA